MAVKVFLVIVVGVFEADDKAEDKAAVVCCIASLIALAVAAAFVDLLLRLCEDMLIRRWCC